MKYLVLVLILIGFSGSAFAQYMGNTSDVQPEKSFPIENRIGSVQALDVPFELKSQHYAEISAENLTITFLKVVGDSRCPSDVTCVWEGKADLIFNISKNQSQEITLSTYTNNTVNVFDKYKIQLIDVKPYPTSTKTIKPEDYVAILKITHDDKIPNMEHPVTKLLSPLKQIKSGISIDKIQCNDSLILVTKYDDSPACVKSDTKTTLIERNWITVDQINKDESISLIKKLYPQLQDFPSDNLPPKVIYAEKSNTGWYVIFETQGSGIPIIEAKCFLVDNSKTVTLIGEYKPEIGEMKTNISFKTCT